MEGRRRRRRKEEDGGGGSRTKLAPKTDSWGSKRRNAAKGFADSCTCHIMNCSKHLILRETLAKVMFCAAVSLANPVPEAAAQAWEEQRERRGEAS